MTLLAPESAIVAGALAIPAVVALYLLKLRRRPLRVSSTVLWMQAAHDLQVNVPLRWLKASLLLILQLLIVLCLALALGRPALEQGASAARKVILIIDRSASMSAVDEGTSFSRLDRARDQAAKIIDDLSRGAGGATVGVISFAADPRVLLGPTPDLSLARDVVNAIGPTDQPGDLAKAVQIVSSLVSPVGGEDAPDPALVVLLSDGSFTAPAGTALGDAEFRFVRVGPTQENSLVGVDNRGITALSARRDDKEPSLVRVFARVVNAGRVSVSTNLTLAFDGTPVSGRAVTVPASDKDGPGVASVSLELTSPAGGVITVTLPGGDALAADDVASLILLPASRPRVLLVSPASAAPAVDGTLTPDELLGDVLAELPLAGLDRKTDVEYAALTLADLAAHDLIIFDRVTPAAVPPVATLSFGAGLPLPGHTVASVDLSSGDGSVGAGTYILTWKRTHPVLRDVAADTIYIARPLALAEPGPDVVAASQIEDLARGAAGPLLRVSEVEGHRHLIAAFELAQTNWPLQPGFTIFLATSVEFLTGKAGDAAALAASTSRAIDVLVPAGAGRLTVEGAQQLSFDVSVSQSASQRSIGPLERAGVYTIRADRGEVAPRVAAINLADDTESALRTRDQVQVSGQSVSAAATGRAPAEIWPWFVMAAGVLLAVEWIVFAIKSRV